MKEYVIENVNECCEQFQKLLLSDRYISVKMLESFMDRYKDSLLLITRDYIEKTDILYKKAMSILNDSYNVVERRNTVYLNRKEKELKQYFDEMFKNIDDSIILSDEQRKSIINDEHYSLVLAGPGTGKTTAIIAKIKYLIEKCNVKPCDIILVSSTDKTSSDLNNILNKDFKLDVTVRTFNQLGLDFIKKSSNVDINIAPSNLMNELISNYVKKILFLSKDKLKYFISTFKEYIFLTPSIYDCPDYDSYIDNKVKELYEVYKKDIDNYISNKTKELSIDNITLRGEKLRNKSEVAIANYLYLNGLDYKCDKLLHADEDNYIADFVINVKNTQIYIEYYALTERDKDGNYIGLSPIINKNYKRKHKKLIDKYGDSLIELYNNTDYIKTLEEELLKRNILLKNYNKKEVFTQLIKLSSEKEISLFIKLATDFITRFKEKGYNLDDFDYLIRNQYIEKKKKQLIFMRDIYEYYQDYLTDNNLVDYNDMINLALKEVEKLKHDYKKLNYSYLIIDDYQDISKRKYDFAKKISDVFNSKIVAVADDLQAIYEFNSTDINNFENFYRSMGYSNIIRMSTSYRNSNELIDVAGSVITQNNLYYSKTLVSSKCLEKPIEINYYDKFNITSKYIVLSNILNRIYRYNKDDKILILSNNKEDIKEYIDGNYFIKGKDYSLISNQYPKLRIDYMTIKESTGLEYDQVILLNEINIANEEDDLLKILDNTRKELIAHPEERRLFYLALTRSKNRVYIMTPLYEVNNRSPYVREISDNINVVEKINI